jgi:hypothetical protein
MGLLCCRYCGNTEFFVLSVHETMCKCGFILTKLSDYRIDEPPQEIDLFPHSTDEQNAEVISKISLLKAEIDKCLDERNKEEFNRLSFELKKILEKGVRDAKVRL